MKTMKYISLRVLAIAALALAFAMPAKHSYQIMDTLTWTGSSTHH